jgi:putative redox protein
VTQPLAVGEPDGATSSAPLAWQEMSVASLGGDRHRIDIRGHAVVVDQPVADGGEDTGPTPTELLVASLASCVAHYARRALRRDGADGPRIRCRWAMSDARPWRVAAVEVDVLLPADTPPARVDAVRRAIGHCTVHNTLADPPPVTLRATVAPTLAGAAVSAVRAG